MILVCSTTVGYSESFGSYIGKIVAEWLDDGRKMRLLDDFAYVDPFGSRWDAPKGSIVDGASIPKFAWSFIGGPFEGSYRNASVIHDVACEQRSRDWRTVHEAFYTGMLASGVQVLKAKIMYAAVYFLGPRWPVVKILEKEMITSSPEQICTSIQGQIVCETVMREKRTKVQVPELFAPPERELEQNQFDLLVTRINERESSSSPMSLEEIRSFR
jgi:hypothetical protein